MTVVDEVVREMRERVRQHGVQLILVHYSCAEVGGNGSSVHYVIIAPPLSLLQGLLVCRVV